MRKFLGVLIAASFTLLAAGCASAPPEEMAFENVPSGSYGPVLDHWTQSEKVYVASNQTFSINATLLSRDVVDHQVYLDAKELHWTPEQYRENRQKELGNLETTTSFFLSVYTQKDDENNLDKSNSLWNIYLEIAGKRYQPQSIKRVYEDRLVLADKFPYVTVWNRNYRVTFAVPTMDATATSCELVVAGRLGDSHLKFPKQ